MKRRSKAPLFLLILPLLVSLACNFSPGGSKSTSETTTTSSPTTDSSGGVRTIPTSEPGNEPTSLPAISASSSDSNSGDNELVMKEPIFIQDGSYLITVFIFENIDTSGVEDIEYTVTASDASGATVETQSGNIDYISAGGRTGVASQMYLDDGVVVENVNIDWTYYPDATGSDLSSFTFENPRYYYDPYWDRFTAVMNNTTDYSYTNVEVDMIAYDVNGSVIGGGTSLLNFVPGNSRVGVNINGFVSDDPVTYEFFPRLSYLSNQSNDPSLFSDVTVVKSGFYYDETILGGGFLVKNNTNEVLQGAEYNLTIYEEDGTVAQVASGIISLIWPGQTLGVSPGEVTLSEGALPTDFEVNVMAGTPQDQEFSSNPLSIQSSNFVADDSFPKVTVTIANSQDQSIDSPYVTVLLYNAADEIIGGGYTYPDPVPANGTLDYDVYVTHVTADDPVRVEAFVSETSY